jgi:hypothetical protein
MGFRFRRSIRLAPGLRINLSKGAPSLSVGGHGLTQNFGPHGARSTFGLPGTGLSYTTRRARRRRAAKGSFLSGIVGLVIIFMVLRAIFG